MAISAKNAGSYVDTASSTTLTVTLPAHAAGDMLIVRAACKQYDATITCGTSGWAAVGNAYANGSTSNGNGVGSLNHRAFYKVATSGSETNPVVTFGATPSPGMAVAIVYQKASTDTWETPTGAGGGDSTARTSQTCTISSHISVRTGDMIDFWLAWCDNYDSTNPTITQSGVTFDTVAEYPATAHSTNTGNDGAMDGGYRLATAGTSSAAAVVTATFGNSEQGGAWQTRLRVVQGITLDLLDGGSAIYAPTIAFPPQTLTVGLIESTPAIYTPTLTPYNNLTLPVLSSGEAVFTRGTQVFADDFSGFSTSTWTGPDTGGDYIWSTYWTNNDNRSEDGVGVIGAVLIDAHAGMSYSDGLSYADVEVQVDVDPTTWGYGFDHGGIAYRHKTASGGFYILGLTLIDATHISLTLKHTPYNSMGYGDGTAIASSGSLAVTTSFATWRIHGFAVGNRHVARIWLASESEPTSWQIDVTDNTYTSAGSIALWDDCAVDDNQTAFDNAGAWQATLEGGGAILYAPTIANASGAPQDISLGLLDGSATLYAPTIVYDKLLDLGLLDGGAAIYEPTLLPISFLTLTAVLDGGATLYEPTLLPISSIVLAAVLDGGATLYEPTITNTLQFVELTLLDGGATLYAPGIYPVQSLTLTAVLDGSATLYEPTLLPINTIELGLLDGARDIYEPTIVSTQVIELGLLDGAAAIYAPTVANTQDITLGLLDGSAAIYAPTIAEETAGGGGPLIPLLLGLGLGAGTGVQTVVLGLLDGAAAIYAPTIANTQVITLDLLDGGATLYAPTIVSTQVIDLGLLDGAAAIYEPTFVPVSTIALTAVLDGGAAVYEPTVTHATPGSVTLGLLDGAAAVYEPTLTPVNTVALGFLDGGAAIYAFGVYPVQSITLGIVDAGSAIYTVTLTPINTIAVDLLDAGNAIYTPTLYFTVTLPLIDGGAAIYAPEVTGGTSVISLDALLDGGADLYAPTLRPDLLVSLDLIDGGRAAYTPTLLPISTIILPLIDGAAATYAPSLHFTVALPLIDGAGTLYEPTIIPGPVTITLGLLDGTSALFEPTLVVAELQIVVPLLDGSRAIYDLTIQLASVTISGYTRNQYGAIIPNCTVDVFRSSDNEFITSTTSDGNGHYSVNVAPGVEHFLVAYSTAKVYGVTARDIVGV